MNTKHENIPLRDAALAAGVVALWGLHLVIIRMGALEIPPFLLLTIRLSIVTAIAAFFVKPIPLARVIDIAWYAIPYLILHLGMLYIGLKLTPAGLGALILQVQVPFAVLLGWLLYKEKFGLKTFAGLALAFGGVLIIIYQPIEGKLSYLGAILILASAFAWAFGSFMMRKIQDLNFTTMTFYSHVVTLPFAAALTLIFEDHQWQALKDANHLLLGGILFYQVVLMSICLFLWKGLMSRNHGHQVTPFVLLNPVFAVIFSSLLLGETLDTRTMIGGIIALLGVTIVTIRKVQKREPLEKIPLE